MPELPEVETICAGLRTQLKPKSKILSVELRRADLRIKMPKDLTTILKGEFITTVRRRAKYLLFETNRGTLLNHLGMTGSWRWMKDNEPYRKHDHFCLHFEDRRRLVYHDPRRFGLMDWIKPGGEDKSQWLKNLGVEPLEAEFTPDYLKQKADGKKAPVKNFIMDQKIVVGVGNIYASEALFGAGVKPLKQVNRLRLTDWESIVLNIKNVLQNSISSGGTTLRDYVNSSGEPGNFQRTLNVYGRAGEKCYKCGDIVVAKSLGGRSTFWCGDCQK